MGTFSRPTSHALEHKAIYGDHKPSRFEDWKVTQILFVSLHSHFLEAIHRFTSDVACFCADFAKPASVKNKETWQPKTVDQS